MTLIGGGGLAWVFKFQREDAGKAVEQVDSAMQIMRLLNEDLSKQFKRVVYERDHALALLDECNKRHSELRARVDGHG
jgi:hypothetical protein